jgi:D-sedoheptulose 7-phosphate isomerase
VIYNKVLEEIVAEISESIEVKKRVLLSADLHAQLRDISVAAMDSLRANGKIIFCGNGGSFADAQHLAAELVSRLRFNRAPLAAVALGTNSSNLTAIGNDYGYENVFARELTAIAQKQDIFIPISTSGNSPNVLEAVKVAKEMGLHTFGFTGGTGGKMYAMCECLIVPSTVTDKIQEVHIMFGHIVCHLIEAGMFATKP